uniref:TAR DNA-binding protein 43 N-terminal domain-containing protein n=1 Tax=Panagrolaimus davidi TaxID=227884 RepID=A0A914PZ34_9BILA
MVNITDRGSNTTLKFNLSDDQTVSFAYLKQYFPGALALIYKDGEKNMYLGFDLTMTKIIPPPDGWKDKTFYVYYKVKKTKKKNTHKQVSASDLISEPQAKRGRFETPISIKEKEGLICATVLVSLKKGNVFDCAYSVTLCTKLMLYFLLEYNGNNFADESIKKCVTIVTKTQAITAGHLIPQGLPAAKIFNVYDAEGQSYPVKLVKLFTPSLDLALLETVDVEFKNVPRGIDMPIVGLQYFVLGYDGEYPYAGFRCFYGRIHKTTMALNEQYIIGSHETTDGCSGGGVFNPHGYLIGICVSGKLNPSNYVGTLAQHLIFLNYGQTPYSSIVPAILCRYLCRQ